MQLFQYDVIGFLITKSERNWKLGMHEQKDFVGLRTIRNPTNGSALHASCGTLATAQLLKQLVQMIIDTWRGRGRMNSVYAYQE